MTPNPVRIRKPRTRGARARARTTAPQQVALAPGVVAKTAAGPKGVQMGPTKTAAYYITKPPPQVAPQPNAYIFVARAGAQSYQAWAIAEPAGDTARLVQFIGKPSGVIGHIAPSLVGKSYPLKPWGKVGNPVTTRPAPVAPTQEDLAPGASTPVHYENVFTPYGYTTPATSQPMELFPFAAQWLNRAPGGQYGMQYTRMARSRGFGFGFKPRLPRCSSGTCPPWRPPGMLLTTRSGPHEYQSLVEMAYQGTTTPQLPPAYTPVICGTPPPTPTVELPQPTGDTPTVLKQPPTPPPRQPRSPITPSLAKQPPLIPTVARPPALTPSLSRPPSSSTPPGGGSAGPVPVGNPTSVGAHMQHRPKEWEALGFGRRAAKWSKSMGGCSSCRIKADPAGFTTGVAVAGRRGVGAAIAPVGGQCPDTHFLDGAICRPKAQTMQRRAITTTKTKARRPLRRPRKRLANPTESKCPPGYAENTTLPGWPCQPTTQTKMKKRIFESLPKASTPAGGMLRPATHRFTPARWGFRPTLVRRGNPFCTFEQRQQGCLSLHIQGETSCVCIPGGGGGGKGGGKGGQGPQQLDKEKGLPGGIGTASARPTPWQRMRQRMTTPIQPHRSAVPVPTTRVRRPMMRRPNGTMVSVGYGSRFGPAGVGQANCGQPGYRHDAQGRCVLAGPRAYAQDIMGSHYPTGPAGHLQSMNIPMATAPLRMGNPNPHVSSVNQPVDPRFRRRLHSPMWARARGSQN